MPNRCLSLAGAQIDPSVLFRTSLFFSGIVNAMVAVHVWGREINNAVHKVKDMFTTIIDSFKEIDTKAICKAMVEWARYKSKEVVQWVKKHPKTTALIVIIVLSIIFGAAAPAMLEAIGLSAAGPVASTIAAGWQASIGSVAARSLFAILQSAAIGSFGVAIVSLASAGIAEGGGGNGGGDDDDDDDDDNEFEGFLIQEGGGGRGGEDGSGGAYTPAEVYGDEDACVIT